MGSSLALSGLSKTKQRLQKGEKTFLCGIVRDGEGGEMCWLCLQPTANWNICCVKTFPAQYKGLGEEKDGAQLASAMKVYEKGPLVEQEGLSPP